jgi:hypothetical protein
MSASMGDLVDDAQRQMETLERARQGSDAAAVDDVACAWLRRNGKGGYVKAFLVMRRKTDTLSWCDLEDLIAIFEPLPLQPEGQGNDDDALAQMLSGLGLDAAR